ncbi:hypothetical protein [Neorhizobium sp. DT-125]|uniref:hypothetical protein n=1 Tax=Neorhizobium sp. DT-125 TaxID=3396163 RepID=UPI003F1CE427
MLHAEVSGRDSGLVGMILVDRFSPECTEALGLSATLEPYLIENFGAIKAIAATDG